MCVNWSQKACAIMWLEVWVLPLKVMGWLGGECLAFPERFLRRDQSLEGFDWKLRDSTLSVQLWRE